MILYHPKAAYNTYYNERKELHDNTWKMTIILNVNKLYWVYYIDILILIIKKNKNNINDDDENIK